MTKAHERAFERIRSAIFSGKYPPGYQLKEVPLAKSLNISRTPIRQAIRALEENGLVEIRSTGRCYVSDVEEAQFDEQLDLLALIESYSAGLAVDHITPEGIERLKELNAAMAKAQSPNEKRSFLDLNTEFHNTIHEYSGSNTVQELLQRLVGFPHNLYLKFGQVPQWHTARSVIEHNQIIQALESGSQEFAKVCMKAHTESVRQAFKQLWVEAEKQ